MTPTPAHKAAGKHLRRGGGGQHEISLKMTGAAWGGGGHLEGGWCV